LIKFYCVFFSAVICFRVIIYIENI
jgi:hypothetical protein